MPNKSITLILLEILTPLTLFLTPLFFLPFLANFFVAPQILLVSFTLLILAGLTLDALLHHPLPLSHSSLRLPLIIFVGVIIANLLANPEARTETLVGPGSLYLALAFLSYFLSQLPSTPKFLSSCLCAIISSSTLLALHGILQLTWLSSQTFLPAYMQSKSFTPTGSPLVTVSLLLLGSLVAFATAFRHRSPLVKYSSIASGTISTIAVIAYLSLMLPGAPLAPITLPLSASWNILLDSYKNVHNLIFGVGLANFQGLYTATKPLFLNSTPLWNFLPQTATTEVFQWLTTFGLLGTLAFSYLIVLGLTRITTHASKLAPFPLVFLGSTLALFILPGSTPLYFLFFVSLGLLFAGDTSHLTLTKSSSYALSLLLASMLGLSGFYLVKFTLSQYYLQQAQLALSQNDGKTVYDSTLRAVNLLPTLTNYRLSFSQVNLALASSLSQKAGLSDEEKNNVSQLLSQAIREGKVATSLHSHSALVWQNLGNIYSNLLPSAEGADRFALDAYSQAVALDAGNPVLRLEFANLLSKLGSLTQDDAQKSTYLTRASSEYQTAIQLKPDFANAYYNFAKFLESNKDYSNSASVMQKAISLLDSDSPDLPRAKTELEAIKAKVPTPSSTPQPQNQAGPAKRDDSLAPSPAP